MKEIDPNQQPRSLRSKIMMRFWHAEGVEAIEAREERIRNSTRANRERAIIAKRVLPLALRGATTEEIHKIQDIKRSQINNMLTKSRASDLLPRPTREETQRAKRLAHLGKRINKGREHVQEEEKLPTQDEKNTIIFAQKLVEKGLVPEDLAYWNGINDLYKNNKRTFSDNFSQKLRLEALFRGLTELRQGNPKILLEYENLGKEIDGQWFKEFFFDDEGFIKAKLLTSWADGEDDKGFFRINENGEKERHVEITEGFFVNASSILVIKTLMSLIYKAAINGNGNDKKRSKKKGI